MADWDDERQDGGTSSAPGFGDGRSGGRGGGFANRGFGGRRDDDSGRGRRGGFGGGRRDYDSGSGGFGGGDNESRGRGGYSRRDDNSSGGRGYGRNDDDSNSRGYRGGRDREGGGFGWRGRDGGFGGGRDRDGGGFGNRDRDGGGFGGRDRDGGGGGFGNRDRDGGGFGGRGRDGGGFGGRDGDGGGYRGRGGYRGSRGDDDDEEGGRGGFRSNRGGRGGSGFGDSDGGSSRGFGSRGFGGGGGGGGGDSEGFVMSRSFVNSSSDDRGRGRGGFRGGRGRDRDEDGGGEFNNFGGRGGGGERFGDDGPRPEPYIPPAPSEKESEIFVNITKGINFGRYDNIPVQLTGREPTSQITTFAEARLSTTISLNVTKAGYNEPTPVQKYGIPVVLAGRDLMGCAQTGSGKTAAFLLPILSTMVSKSLYQNTSLDPGTAHPTALIIAPTRELALQIYHEARKFSYTTIIEPVVAYGGTSVAHQLSKVEKGCHILVGTPGRLIDFMNRGRVKLDQVKFLVLDEADRMLDMGFIPDVKKMVHEFDMCGKNDRQTLMFSATFPEEIQRLAADFLHDYLFLTVGKVGGAANDIVQKIVQVAALDKREKLAEILRANPEHKVLVFVETKRQADFLATYLSQEAFPTTSIHGARLQREREEALHAFKTGRTPVLVATSVAARGLDIPKVNHVVNFDMPSDISEYVHRIGRTGRIGHTGLATSFFDSAKDQAIARSLVKILSDAEQDVPVFLEEIAEGAIGTGYGGAGGGFGGTDRRERGGGGRDSGNRADGYGGQTFGDPINTGFASSVPPTAGDDESWD
ncbi:vasa A [Oopsacas minuta]|uniref:RNA helicase n=1 Tax=Oopsacas minuta TaxID=111878 RepID=A0A1W5RTB9_9METZ|nr:vasa A [Oopsacas minuta]KAI6651658.1 vasa A [Oopsacas minuta]